MWTDSDDDNFKSVHYSERMRTQNRGSSGLFSVSRLRLCLLFVFVFSLTIGLVGLIYYKPLLYQFGPRTVQDKESFGYDDEELVEKAVIENQDVSLDVARTQPDDDKASNTTVAVRVTSIAAKSQPTDLCDVTQYLMSLDGTDPTDSLRYISGCTRFLYNRVPKCASRTIKDIFKTLGPANHFNMTFIDDSYSINTNLNKTYIAKMTLSEPRFVIVSHFYFADFRSVYPSPLAYINIVREPMSWFKSVYNWHRYGTNHREDVNRPFPYKGFENPLVDCIKDAACLNRVMIRFGIVTFFCGNTHQCFTHNEESLKQAKKNVDEYLLVGVYEQLPDFLKLLETILPHMFKGSIKVFDEINVASHDISTTRHKDTVDDPVLIKKLQDALSLEYDLYNHIHDKFQKTLEFYSTLMS